MEYDAITTRLFDRGWSHALNGLWYRPFPNNTKAGLLWCEAALEVGFTDDQVEAEYQRRQGR